MTAHACVARCGRERGQGKYLCYECWGQLPRVSRRALNRVDNRAMSRLAELIEQIRKQVPLSEIRVTP